MLAKAQKPYTENLELAHYPPEVREMMDSATHCLHCGAPLKENENYQARRNRGYCKYSHYIATPPLLAYAAREHGGKPVDVILQLLRKTNSISLTADLMGVHKQTLAEWMRKLKIKRVVKWEVG